MKTAAILITLIVSISHTHAGEASGHPSSIGLGFSLAGSATFNSAASPLGTTTGILSAISGLPFLYTAYEDRDRPTAEDFNNHVDQRDLDTSMRAVGDYYVECNPKVPCSLVLGFIYNVSRWGYPTPKEYPAQEALYVYALAYSIHGMGKNKSDDKNETFDADSVALDHAVRAANNYRVALERGHFEDPKAQDHQYYQEVFYRAILARYKHTQANQ